MLLVSTRNDIPSEEMSILKEKLLLTKNEMLAIEKLKIMRRNFNSRREFNSKFTYNISRYVPLMHDLLRAFVHKKSIRFSKLLRKEVFEKKENLSKSSFVFR